MHRKKILFIATTPFYSEKGSSLRIYTNLKVLSSIYFVDFISYIHGEEVQLDNVRFYRTSKLFKPEIKVSKPSPAKVFLDVLVFLKAFYLIMNNKYEVIHCEDFEAAFIGSILKKFFNIKIVYSLHNRIVQNIEISGKKPHKMFYKIERWVISSSDHIILNWESYVSDPVFKNLRNLTVILDTLTKAVDDIHINYKKFLFYSGNFEPYQGLFEFLDVYRVSTTKIPLLIAGNPNQTMIEYINKYNLEESVLLLGKLPIETTNKYIESSLACVLPRVAGIQPSMKLIHYLMWCKPVIARRIQCNLEFFVDGPLEKFLYNTENELKNVLENLDSHMLDESYKSQAAKIATEITNLQDEARLLNVYKSLVC